MTVDTIDTTKLTSLERKVYGKNTINKLTIKNLETVIPQLQSYVGKKIRRADQRMSKKFEVKHDLDESIEGNSLLRSFFNFIGDNMYLRQDFTLKAKSIVGGGHVVEYYENEVYVGTIDNNGYLKNVDSIESITYNHNLDEVYSIETVKADLVKLDRLEVEVRHLRHNLRHFK